jgi:hypothetical protein
VNAAGWAVPNVCLIMSMLVLEPPIGADCKSSLPPVSTRTYRSLPEAPEVAFVALTNYFTRHPPKSAEPVCVSTPGYNAPGPKLRSRLKEMSVPLDADENCRYRESQIVHGVVGVWRTEAAHFVADVHVIEFGDVSVELASYRYTVERSGHGFAVVNELASPCNPR